MTTAVIEPKQELTKLSDYYTSQSCYTLIGGVKYAFTFNFTSKEDYLKFRALWRAEYAKMSAATRANRKAYIAYRNAGGFGRKNVVGNLEEAAAIPHVAGSGTREDRHRMVELRRASKVHAQACWLAAHAAKQ